MAPRRLGVSRRTVVWASARSSSQSRSTTCQNARRLTRAREATRKTTSRTRRRRRESVRPSIGRYGSATGQDDRLTELGQPGIDRELAYGRLLAEPLQVGVDLLLL